MSDVPEQLFVACPCCGRDEPEERFQKQGFRIVRCRGCGLSYVNPRLTADALDRMYNAQTISRMQYYVQTAADDRPSFVRRLRLIERERAPGRLLDVGCGPGTFLAVARERGWTALGMDINAASVARCREQGLDALAGPFPHAELAGRTFDAIVLNDVIEHLPEPRAALAQIHGMLAPGGVLFISTPDIGSSVARVSGVNWLHLKPIEHLTYFDRRTLARVLIEARFQVVHCAAIGRNRNLGLIVDRLSTYSGAFSRALLRVMPLKWATRVSFPVNPGDEMGLLARKLDAR